MHEMKGYVLVFWWWDYKW